MLFISIRRTSSDVIATWMLRRHAVEHHRKDFAECLSGSPRTRFLS